jgi:Holliday junction DNA helicase RuvA
MIARLAGLLFEKSTEALVVDVRGVGYRVQVSLHAFAALPQEGQPIELAVHTHLRENALELFGFIDPQEKNLFGALLGVSGVGPRMALNILSGIPAADLIDALAEGDVARLVSVPGIGKRTAERLVVELHDRVRHLHLGGERDPMGGGALRLEEEATSALTNLGYRRGDAQRAVREAMGEAKTDIADVIRGALGRLSS